MRYSPSISQAIIAVKIGAEDLIVSEKETATYFKVMREHTIVANLGKEIEEKKTLKFEIKSKLLWRSDVTE